MSPLFISVCLRPGLFCIKENKKVKSKGCQNEMFHHSKSVHSNIVELPN